MSLDWLTIGAQTINFLVLIWLLKRFLYAPIMNAMDRREARIAARFADARTREAEAAERARTLEAAKRELDEARATLMADARRAADEHEQDLIRQTKAEVGEQGRTWKRLVEQERSDFLAHLQKVMAGQVCELARAALEDLADTDLEPHIVRVFCHMLLHLPESERTDFMTGYAQADGEIEIHTPLSLPTALRDEVRDALRKITGDDASIRFLTDKAMSAGIIAKAGSRSVSWTIDSYMKHLQRRVEGELDALLPMETAQ